MLRPVLQRLASFSPVWIVPVAALLIAIGLGLRAWEQRGVEVEIIFDSASGIEVGKTSVRLKDVEVGTVTAVRLTPDLRQVRVMVELDQEVSRHLSSNTRFWVVTPRVSASGISNLGTLISGVYIVMDPGEPGPDQSVFVALSEPPAVASDEEGSSFVLQAEQLGSLDIGSPVYYRQFRVGEVTSYHLAPEGDYVAVNIFVPAPYDELVQTRSRFWNVSGFGFKMGAEGVEAKMASLASLISGGVAFGNSAGFEGDSAAPDGHRFLLYEDEEAVLAGRYSLEHYYLLKFRSSVRGLSVGAPVEYRGLTVGEVVDVALEPGEVGEDRVHVYISIEPQRLRPDAEPSREEADDLLASMVREGLRARLKTGNLITGSRYVDLAYAGEGSGELISLENYSVIPTIDDPLDSMSRELASVVDKLNQVPFDDIGRDLAGSMAALNRSLKEIEQRRTVEKLDNSLHHIEDASKTLAETLASAKTALEQMEQTLRTADNALAPDSELHYELVEALKSVERASRSFEALTEELNRYPNSLIFGVDKQ